MDAAVSNEGSNLLRWIVEREPLVLRAFIVAPVTLAVHLLAHRLGLSSQEVQDMLAIIDPMAGLALLVLLARPVVMPVSRSRRPS